MLKISIAQLNPTIGDVEGNAGLMREAAKAALAQSAALVVFPELSLTGYYPGDLLDDKAFQARIQETLQELIAASNEKRPPWSILWFSITDFWMEISVPRFSCLVFCCGIVAAGVQRPGHLQRRSRRNGRGSSRSSYDL